MRGCVVFRIDSHASIVHDARTGWESCSVGYLADLVWSQWPKRDLSEMRVPFCWPSNSGDQEDVSTSDKESELMTA